DPNDPGHENGLKIVEKALRKKCFKGVKVQLAMTPCKVEDLFPVAKLLEEFDLPIYVHLSGGLFASRFMRPFFLKPLIKNFPKLKIILGHAASTMEFCIETIFTSIDASNIYFETSVSIPFGIISLVKMFGSKRVIFGSDSPAATTFHIEYQKIQHLKLSKRAKMDLFSNNIKRLIHFED
ncbi:MAG: amidohydrolase family protein, partial [Promethearchaeota archaeon]